MGWLLGSSIRFGHPGGLVVGVALCAAFALLIAFGVRQALRVPVLVRRAWLVALRIATGLAALLFALQPQWVSERIQNVEGRLAVLVDASRSMSVRDVTPSRAERALELLRRFRQRGKPPFDLYLFGADARPAKLEAVDKAALTREDDTRIVPALERVVAELGEDLSAIVLISDGADLGQHRPAAQLKKLGVRVHTIAFNPEHELDDDAIVAVNADPVAFLRQAAQVEVSVRSTRTPRQPLIVSLREQDQLVGEAKAELDEHGVGKVVLPFTPARLGRALYTLSIPLSDGDTVPENNERAFLVRVTRDKLRVLLLCGAPTWDTRFLRAFLKADPAIDLITFFILRTSSDLAMASPEELSLIPFPTDELFREHLDSFDFVMFQDFNYGPYQVAAYLPKIRDYVRDGGAFAMIGGSRAFGAGGYEHTPLAEILPVRMIEGQGALSETEFNPVLVENMARHPIVELVPDPIENQKNWAELAPLAGANRLLGVREGSYALLAHPSEKDAHGGPMPVLAVGSFGRGRVLALAVDSSWRWGMTTAGRRGDASAYDSFWDRALRWLARDPLLDPAHIATDKERYGPGAEQKVRMLLRDQSYQPIANRELELVVLDMQDGVQATQSVHSDAEGAAGVELRVPMRPGPYRVAVRERLGEPLLAEQGFVVEAGGEELADPRARPDLLREIANATGGSFYSIADAPDLDHFDRTRARTLGTAIRAPFGSAWFFGALIALFAVEWILRRSWGLR